MEGLTPNNLCPHVTFTCKGRKPAVCGILTKPGLKIHNLGCVYFVELALTAFSHLVDHEVLSRASIYSCNFTFLRFFNLTFCLSWSYVDFVVQASRKREQQPALQYMVTTEIKEHQIFHQELFGSLLQQSRWINKSHLHRRWSSVCQGQMTGLYESMCSWNPCRIWGSGQSTVI